jgi:multiple sugar transport system ATP-binding protein
MASVVLENVSKIYPGIKNAPPAVDDINVEVKDHEFVALIGPSGCGKSTTLRMIAGLESITMGSIFIDGTKVNDLTPKDRNVSMVFQNYALYPTLTNFENIAFGLRVAKVQKYKITEDVNRVARSLELDNLLDRFPRQLSGGQRQRVALGRAIVRDPKVFLLDEPLSNLDAKMRVQMRYELIELHKKLNATTVYVTHDQIEAMTMASKIVIMDRGVIQQTGTPTEVYNRPANTFVGGFIGTPPMNFIEGVIETRDNEPYFINSAMMLRIPDKQFAEISEKRANSCYLGIRPEHLRFMEATSAPAADSEEEQEETAPVTASQVVKGRVRFSELVGADQNVHVDLGKRVRVIVKASTDHALAEDDLAVMRINMNRLLFYDMNSGQLVA